MSKQTILRKQSRSIRTLGLESLEARQVLAVTFHGGATMPKVEAQAVYYGSDWKTSAPSVTQRGVVDTYVKYIVNSPYMDMLHDAGYGVNRGTADTGYVVNKVLDKTKFVYDAQIRGDLQHFITTGSLKAPNANRLYVVFVEPNVVIKDASDGSTSINDFLGYHGAYAGTDATGKAVDIRYAVIAYPSGRNGTAASQGYNSNLDYLTSVTSHEIAEAVTDPNVGYKKLGWYDDAKDGEIGDIVSGDVVLNKYCVQKESSKSNAALSPKGSTPYTFNGLLNSAVLSTTSNAGSATKVQVSASDPIPSPTYSGVCYVALEAHFANQLQLRDAYFNELAS